MPITWDANADRKLLLAILTVHEITINYKDVAAKFSEDGQACTEVAIRRRMQAIRATLKSDGDSSYTTTKATPRKRAAASKDGEDEEDGTPSKKTKGGKGKASKKSAVKEEDGDEEDDA